jgi:hypothetical protein
LEVHSLNLDGSFDWSSSSVKAGPLVISNIVAVGVFAGKVFGATGVVGVKMNAFDAAYGLQPTQHDKRTTMVSVENSTTLSATGESVILTLGCAPPSGKE